MNPKYQKVCAEIAKTEKKVEDLQGQLKEMLLRVDRHLLQQVYPIRIFLLRQRPVKLQFMSKRLCY